MKALGTTLFPLALVALLAALSFWLERAANPDSPVLRAQKRHDPDYLIHQLRLRSFDASGMTKQSLLASSLTHYPDDGSTHVTEPRLTYHVGGRETRLSAKRGELTRDNEQVVLRGDVHLIKPAAGTMPATVLRTETLTVFPNDDTASSGARVTITRGQSSVSGDRLHYDGKSSVAVLSGRVKGVFLRAKKS